MFLAASKLAALSALALHVSTGLAGVAASRVAADAGCAEEACNASASVDGASLLQAPSKLAAASLEQIAEARTPGGADGNWRRPGATPRFCSKDAAKEPPLTVALRSRVYVPFGAGAGFGFGLGAAEQVAFDPKEQYLYAVSQQGALNVVDYHDPYNPKVITGFGVTIGGQPNDVEVCGGLVFVSVQAVDALGDGAVLIYTAAAREAQRAPTLHAEVAVGPLPDMVLPNAACSVLAVANEGEGAYSDEEGLRDPPGSVDIIWNLWAKSPSVYRVSLRSLGGDKALEEKGVHLPLSLNALTYWEKFSGLELNFTTARRDYRTDSNLEPEFLGWSGDDSKLFVNLQENNAVATISFSKWSYPKATDVNALGLKDWSATGGTEGLDIVEDQKCRLAAYPGFFGLRNADGIAVVEVDGQDYILTANEGDDKSYGDFDELVPEDEVLDAKGRVLMNNVVATDKVVASHLAGLKLGGSPERRIGRGSSAMDFSDPRRPVLQRLVNYGARGISIYKKTGKGLELVWDSGSELEREQCAAFPWAHNGEQDEEFAPLFGVLYNTTDDEGLREAIEENNDPDENGCEDGGDGQPGACPLGQTVDARSPKDGAAPEAVAVGVACGRLLAVTATEKQSTAFVYDITNIRKPQLLFTRHLSPASRTKNPGVAYASRELGEIDPEGLVFVQASESPSGKAGFFFAGAFSGTVSFWEFQCP